MKTRRVRRWVAVLATALGLWAPALGAFAMQPGELRSLVEGDTDARVAALHEAVARGDAQLVPVLQALLADELRFDDAHVWRVHDGIATDALSGASTTLPDAAQEVVVNNRLRGQAQAALAALQLGASDRDVREKAIATLRDVPDESQLGAIDAALAHEADASLQGRLRLLKASVLITSPDRARRLKAVEMLSASADPATRALLGERLGSQGEADPQVRARLQEALSAVDARLAWGERIGVLFAGASLGSILLLVALGLAITYGLMGVINMAHGELMMIGAYATAVVQNLFRAHLPAASFDWYIVAAIPASFLASALVGAVLERGVIRWLYGRPLETLLATWGISLVLIQSVRTVFGAQNVQVENPSWLSGGAQVMSNLVLPYNRLAIIAFAGIVLAGVALLIARTRLGLFVRAVTQNRRMAACVGVNTAHIDTQAFALGAGIAGLAGCALSQVGNVGPDLGQTYIVDSFMVVVLGGVGQLTGAVVAALGLGVLNKLLEGAAGPVLAKIIVLAFIVVFIQKRPQGLFALKGRSAEA